MPWWNLQVEYQHKEWDHLLGGQWWTTEMNEQKQDANLHTV